MHPGFFWWKMGRDCGSRGGWAQGERRWEAFAGGEPGGFGGFGVRRPLRFLAYKLQLDEAQVTQLAKILNELKTERAQAEVDDRRTVAAFADAVGGASFDQPKADAAAALRVKSAERLKEAVLKALGRIHALLNEEQRGKLAYLIRTGTVSL